MRAVRCLRHGPVADVVLDEQPDPVPGPGELLIRVRAAAVNYPDVLVVAGRYQVPVPAPFTVGSELAGEVVGTGEGVGPAWLGRRVMAACLHGAFADLVCLPVRQVQEVPAGLGDLEAAAFHVTYTTAWQSLVTVAEARAGDWVVVLGAAGGVGSACVDIGARLGLRVVGVVSSAERAALCLRLGAVAAVEHSQEDVKAALRSISDGGTDVVIDPVGGPLAEVTLRSMRWGGRFVTVGYASGEIPRIPLNLVLLKGITVRGMELRSLYEHRPDAEAACRAALGTLVADGMAPHVSQVHPLAHAAAALADVAGRRVTGKVVLDLSAQ